MKKTVIFVVSTLVLLCACSNRDQAPAADNTARNAQDRSGDALTAQDQSNDQHDRALTQRVRQAVTSDDSLSTTARNVKIITVGGVVTLRGPVNNPHEKDTIGATAEQIAGTGRVVNQLEVVAQ